MQLRLIFVVVLPALATAQRTLATTPADPTVTVTKTVCRKNCKRDAFETPMADFLDRRDVTVTTTLTMPPVEITLPPSTITSTTTQRISRSWFGGMS